VLQQCKSECRIHANLLCFALVFSAGRSKKLCEAPMNGQANVCNLAADGFNRRAECDMIV
jgi:hypothetical protein